MTKIMKLAQKKKRSKDRKKSLAYRLLVPRLRFLGVCRFVGRGQRSGLVLFQAARLCEEQAAGPVPARAASPASPAAEETSSQRGVSVSRHQGEVRPSAGRVLGKNMMEQVTCILVCWCAVGETGVRCENETDLDLLKYVLITRVVKVELEDETHPFKEQTGGDRVLKRFAYPSQQYV